MKSDLTISKVANTTIDFQYTIDIFDFVPFAYHI